MITLNKSYQLNPAVANAPYTYSWNSTNPCVTFSPTTGTTTDGKVDVTMTFPDETCLINSTITINYSGTLGCAYSNTVAIGNVCEGFSLAPINLEAPFAFSTSAASPGCTTATFDWIYDNSLFSLLQQSGTTLSSELQLVLRAGLTSLPGNTDVVVMATDCNGCERTQVYTYTFETLAGQDLVVNMTYDGVQFASEAIILAAPSGYSTAIDWTTLSFQIGESQIIPTITNNIVSFTAPLTLGTGQFQGTYTYNDVNGVSAVPGTLQFVLHPYRTISPINTTNIRYELDCSALAGEIVNIPVEDAIAVTTGTVVDWTSFALVTPPVTASPSITLTTDINGDHVIAYQVPNPEQDDSFAFTICDTNGNCARASVVTVVNCVTAPVAVDDASCATCNETVEIDVLSNDTSAGTLLDTNSIVLTEQPTSGAAYVQNGKVYYTGNKNTTGSDTIKYTVDNTYGTTSNEATVTITAICAGPDTSVNLCTDTITPFDSLTNASTGGTWTYTGTTNPAPAAPGTHDGTLDFTGFTKDVAYEYTYTVTNGSCSDATKLTINAYDHTVTPNFLCSKATLAPITPTTQDVSYTYTNQDNSSTCPGPSAPVFDSSIAIPAQWESAVEADYAGDLWYSIAVNTAASATVTVEVNTSTYAGEAMTYPNLAIYDSCNTGDLLNAYAPGPTQFFTNGRIDISGATSNTYYIRVASLLANAGKFNLKLNFFVNPI